MRQENLLLSNQNLVTLRWLYSILAHAVFKGELMLLFTHIYVERKYIIILIELSV